MGGKHTPGKVRYVPWHIEEGAPAVRTEEGWLLCATSSDEDAKRIAECWNACADIPDPSAIREAVEVVRAMAKFDGRNNNAALKQMACEALAKLEVRSND